MVVDSIFNEEKVYKTAQLHVMFYNEKEEIPPKKFDDLVILNYFRVKMAERIWEARVDCSEGRFEKASELLEDLYKKMITNKVIQQQGLYLLSDLKQSLILCRPNAFDNIGELQMCSLSNCHMNELS